MQLALQWNHSEEMMNLQHYYKCNRICHLCRANKWSYMKAPSTLNTEFRHSLDTFLEEAIRPGPSYLQVEFSQSCFFFNWEIRWTHNFILGKKNRLQLSIMFWSLNYKVLWQNCRALVRMYWSSALCTSSIWESTCGWQGPSSNSCWISHPMRFGRELLLQKDYPMRTMHFENLQEKGNYSTLLWNEEFCLKRFICWSI